MSGPDEGTRFLTMEEVKAAQAEALERERGLNPADSHSIMEEVNRPQKPQLQLHRRKKKTLNSRIRQFFSDLRFKRWKRKRSSSSASEYQYLTFEDIKRAKENQEQIDYAAFADKHDFIQSPGLQQDSTPVHRHKHKKRKRKFWKFFRFRKKKQEPILLTQQGLVTTPEREKIRIKAYLRATINSTSVFIVSYLIAWLVYQLTVMIVASLNDIDSVLYYYEVMFPVGNTSPKWSQINIIFITLSGPLISFIFWALYRFVFLKKFHPGAQMRLFLVWLCLNSMILFFGSFVGGAITRQGFGYVVDWLYINVAFRILLSLIFLSLIGWISWKIVRFLPETSGLDSFKHNRFGFVLSRLVVPWFIGGIILILMKITDVIPQHENIFNYDAFTIASMLFAVATPLFNSKTQPHLIQGRKTYPRVHRSTVFLWTVLAILMIILVRFGLSKGLHFQLIFDLSIGIYH